MGSATSRLNGPLELDLLEEGHIISSLLPLLHKKLQFSDDSEMKFHDSASGATCMKLEGVLALRGAGIVGLLANKLDEAYYK